jgi:hypothetical protein
MIERTAAGVMWVLFEPFTEPALPLAELVGCLDNELVRIICHAATSYLFVLINKLRVSRAMRLAHYRRRHDKVTLV